MRRSRSPRLVAALAVCLAVVTACSGLPTQGPPVDVRKVADQTTAVPPHGPDAGQQPDQIVREFIHANALTSFDPVGESFIVARAFLTPRARAAWQADAASSAVTVLADDFTVALDPANPGQVTITGTQIGLVEPDRSYRPIPSEDYVSTLQLENTDGQWRISQPPADVVITEGDFDTAFRQRTVYFLDASGQVVVPDIRYIPISSSPELAAGRLLDLLLGGPSDLLAGAARTQLGPDASLQSNVSIDDAGVAHVDLAGVDTSTAAARQALVAQIVWTLDPDVQQIAITVDGLPLAGPSEDGRPSEDAAATGKDAPPEVYSLRSGSVATFDPDAVPGSAQAVSDAYYIDSGAVVRLSDGAPMWGSVGTGSVGAVSAALSAASGVLAAVARGQGTGEELLVGRPFEHQPMVTALKADTLTRPSFTRWGYTVWTVQNGATKPEVYQVAVSAGAPTWSQVPAENLAELGDVTALQLSPDGVRVAVVADKALYLGVIAPDVDGPGAPGGTADDPPAGHAIHLTGLRILRADLTDVGPVIWEDSTSLLVGARTAGSTHRTVFEVSVDGQEVEPLTTSQVFGDVFGDVEAIAAPRSSGPLLISFQGRIWQLQGSRTSGHWVQPGGGNWISGTAPFYPH